MTKLSEITGIRPDPRKFVRDSALVLNRCDIGIEVELENVKSKNTFAKSLEYWNVVNDGSLREEGAEFISFKVRGADIRNALEELRAAIKEYSPDVTAGPRTSTHIHMDVTSLDFDQLINLMCLYMIFEETLFEYIGHDRRDNNYCVPLYMSSALLTAISNNFFNTLKEKEANLRTKRMGFEEALKYSALNIGPAVRQGSIEFRHMYGTTDFDKVYDWINVIMCLKKYILSYTGTAQELIDSVCAKREQLLADVFEDYLGFSTRIYTFKDMLEGARVAQSFINISKAETIGRKDIKGKLLFSLYKKAPTKNSGTFVSDAWADARIDREEI